MRDGQYEYIHEFKERINEIVDLQKFHHQIIDSATEPTTVKQIISRTPPIEYNA